MTLLVEWEDLMVVIFIIFLGMAILLVISGFIVNMVTAKKIWNPFFQNLNTVQGFSVRSQQPLHLLASDIDEFTETNAVLSALTERVRNDYKALREFTENASHESQTPLTIIQSKLERLSQHPGMDKQMAESITAALSAADRVTKLNRNLLLLAKLENQQFELHSGIDISELLMQQVNTMKDLFDAKNIKLLTDIKKEITVKGSDPLLEIMISNLLSNVLRYTPEAGNAAILLTGNELSFSNSGEVLSFPAKEIFDRFKKGQADSTSNGLGLAIVMEIVMLHHWQIHYAYHEGQHTFTVSFTL